VPSRAISQLVSREQWYDVLSVQDGGWIELIGIRRIVDSDASL
jgi:hypothetical protein